MTLIILIWQENSGSFQRLLYYETRAAMMRITMMMMMMLTSTVTSESHEGTHSINNDWIYFQKYASEILWISEWYLHVDGTEFSTCWDVHMSCLTLSPWTREPWRNDTYKTPHFGELTTSALAEIRSNVCRSPHFLLSLAFSLSSGCQAICQVLDHAHNDFQNLKNPFIVSWPQSEIPWE